MKNVLCSERENEMYFAVCSLNTDMKSKRVDSCAEHIVIYVGESDFFFSRGFAESVECVVWKYLNVRYAKLRKVPTFRK